jgi:hypothetical protein
MKTHPPPLRHRLGAGQHLHRTGQDKALLVMIGKPPFHLGDPVSKLPMFRNCPAESDERPNNEHPHRDSACASVSK